MKSVRFVKLPHVGASICAHFSDTSLTERKPHLIITVVIDVRNRACVAI